MDISFFTEKRPFVGFPFISAAIPLYMTFLDLTAVKKCLLRKFLSLLLWRPAVAGKNCEVQGGTRKKIDLNF